MTLSAVFMANLEGKEEGGAMPSLGSTGFFQLGDSSSTLSFSVLVNVASSHGGTPI
jgi:hypothetical protein